MRSSALLTPQCRSYRFAVLNAFISLAGFSLRPLLKPAFTGFPFRNATPKRSFQAWAAQRSEILDPYKNLENREENNEIESDGAENKVSHATSVAPWYLQVDTPQHATRPLSERQRLPELPENPPPLLQPVLEHISIKLGLDDLTLYDLRALDPPPALGANLLMILGTARSEKHLHVSADRFCRWLRSTHSLAPYADGLLGRGELKLKLKRRARRAKLLSSVGSSESSKADDGLRTGWVCVNVGTLEDGGGTAEAPIEDEGFVGFGDNIWGTKLVVQMMTEEKREELNLEELWGNMPARQQRRRERRLKSLGEPETNEEVGPSPPSTANSLPDMPSSVYFSRSGSSHGNAQQTRSFHTNSRRSETNVYRHTRLEMERSQPPPAGDHKSSLGENHEVQDFSISCKRSESEQTQTTSQYLTAALTYIKGLPRQEALELLGTGAKDFHSTTFLASFYNAIPLIPSTEDWVCRWQLVRYANYLGHPNYKKRHLLSLFDEMRASVHNVPEDVYHDVLEIVLSWDHSLPNHVIDDKTKAVVRFDRLEKSLRFDRLEKSLRLIEELKFCRKHAFTDDVLMALYYVVASIPVDYHEFISSQKLRPDAIRHLRLFMDHCGFEFPDAQSFVHIKLLNILAEEGNWPGYWAHWRGFAKRWQAKTPELYTLMFTHLAQTGHQRNCMDAIRTWAQEMEYEEPPVMIRGEVAEALMECLKVAEPDVEMQSNEGQNTKGEWVRLWRYCELGLEEGYHE